MTPKLNQEWILRLILILGVITCVRSQAYRGGKAGEQITTTLNTILNGYDRRVRPNFGVHPVDIGISMYVLMVDALNDSEMDFTMTFYFRQKWRDPRLKFSGFPQNISVHGNELSDKIWLPDTFFVNQKSKESSDSFTRITSEGDVLRTVKMTVTASCPSNLRYFPMDSQTCVLEIESFAATMVDIRYNWASGTDSVGISPTSGLPGWKVVGYRPSAVEIALSTGNYSRLAVSVQFTRSVGFYLVSVYLPVAIVVALSWISLWINYDAMTARLLTGVGSAITLLQIWQCIQSSLPKISYIKAIDVYLAGSMAIVFLTLIEHAMVTCLITRRKDYKKSMQNDVSRSGGGRRKPCCLKMAPFLLDWFSRFAIAALFIGFNILYWKCLVGLAEYKDESIIPLNPLESLI